MGMKGTASKTVLSSARSLPVPNVQELAATISAINSNGSGKVPERYIRPEVEADPVASPDAGEKLPVIDVSKLLDPEFLDKEELAKLGLACKEWGFFQVINHRVPDEVINKMKDDMKEFFKLPMKEKEAIKQSPDKVEGYGQIFVQSEEQQLDWADMLILIIHHIAMRDMRFWPTNPATFRSQLRVNLLGIH